MPLLLYIIKQIIYYDCACFSTDGFSGHNNCPASFQWLQPLGILCALSSVPIKTQRAQFPLPYIHWNTAQCTRLYIVSKPRPASRNMLWHWTNRTMRGAGYSLGHAWFWSEDHPQLRLCLEQLTDALNDQPSDLLDVWIFRMHEK